MSSNNPLSKQILRSSIQMQEAEQEESSSEEPSTFQLPTIVDDFQENKKRVLYSKGLYSIDSGEICTKYIEIADHPVTGKHPYRKYPAVTDPGINQALCAPQKPLVYTDDGQELYLTVCEEMNICPVSLFHTNLQNEEINLSYYGVNPRGVRAMAIALQYNRKVRRLNLTENFLNDDACYHLNQMLQSNVTLKELILTGCRIGSSGTRRLIEDININRALKRLNLARNNIGDEGGILIAGQIDRGCTVKRFNLSNNQLGRPTAMAFTEALMFNDKITNFDLSRNNFFHIPSTVKMLQELTESQRLYELNLSWNSLGGERLGEVIKNIMLAPNLMILDLSHNKFEGEAVTGIASNLMKAKKLVTLDLSFNPLSPNDAYNLLQKMLRPRVKLVNLLIEDVRVSKTFPVLLDRVRRMKSRKNFVIKYGSIVENWTIEEPDARELILRRADYLGNMKKKHKRDIPLFFLELSKEIPKPLPSKEFLERMKNEGLPLDEDLLNEFVSVFPGPKSGKTKTVNLQDVCEYIHRLWPEKKLPPTPPPEEETELNVMPKEKQTGKKK